jgi:phosphotransferase system HPr-like phosphotransfer protein
MASTARVTLSGDPNGMHARPVGQVARAIQGMDASVVFRRGGDCAELDLELPAFSLMQAAAQLGIARGVSFEVTCDGPDGERAFLTLRRCFTEGYFEGGTFEAVGPPQEGAST